MDRSAIKDFIYGGLTELVRDRKYYYHSSAGSTYSHLTEEGRVALVEYMEMVSWKMLEVERTDIDKRAKEMVLSGLKGESV